jgi:hypothetical protein
MLMVQWTCGGAEREAIIVAAASPGIFAVSDLHVKRD